MAEQRATLPVGSHIAADWARTAGKLVALGVGSALFGALWLGPTLRHSLEGRQIAAKPDTQPNVKPVKPKPGPTKDPLKPIVVPGKIDPDGKPLKPGGKTAVAKPPVPKPNPIVTPPPVPPTPGRPLPPEHATQPVKPEPVKPQVPVRVSSGQTVYRVWLGQFADREAAEAFRKKLVTDVNHPAMPTLFRRPDGQITVQAGAFRKADGALRMVESYRQRGYQPEAVAEER